MFEINMGNGLENQMDIFDEKHQCQSIPLKARLGSLSHTINNLN
jgi:hypothetical protein